MILESSSMIPSRPSSAIAALKMQQEENIPEPAVSDEPNVHPFVSLVTSCFDNEYARVGIRDRLNASDNPESEQIGRKYLEMHTKAEFFAFFTAQSLEDIAKEVLTNEMIRSFHLNITERVSAGVIAMVGFDVDKFTDELVQSVGRNKPEPKDDETSSSLINKEVLQSIFVQPEVLKKLLKGNFWILVMYVLLSNFQHTLVHAALVQDLFQKKSPSKQQ